MSAFERGLVVALAIAVAGWLLPMAAMAPPS